MYEIYLLDDEKWLLEDLYLSIDWNAYNSTVIAKSTNSVESYKNIKYRNPDIVFTDIRMPDLDGIKLMEKLVNDKCESVFIVITGHAEFEYAQQAIKYGAVSYCLKPFDEKDIINALIKAQKVCEGRKVLKALHKGSEDEQESSNQSFQMICDYIHENFMKDISLQFLAKKYHLNASYLSNLFKKESGMTYSAYITDIRLNYASELLVKTELTINDIAEKSGFQNYVYFARLFKNKKGHTPTQYRELNR